MQAYKCDRCGVLYESGKLKHGDIIKIITPQISFRESLEDAPGHFDLCNRCYGEFIDWFNLYHNGHLKLSNDNTFKMVVKENKK